MIIRFTPYEMKRLREIFNGLDKPVKSPKKPQKDIDGEMVKTEDKKPVTGENEALKSKCREKLEEEKIIDVVPAEKKKTGKKKTFFIYGRFHGQKPGTSERKGYIYSINGILFGLHKETPKSHYTITDILTGFSIGKSCKTLNGIYDVITPELINIINDKHTCTGLYSTEKIQNEIRAAYNNIGVNIEDLSA